MPESRFETHWRPKLHEIIFEAETPAGKAFDVVLLVAIVVSVAVVILESVPGVRAEYGPALRTIEWIITILFTIEYILRLVAVGNPLRYALSFFGLVDLLALRVSLLQQGLTLAVPKVTLQPFPGLGVVGQHHPQGDNEERQGADAEPQVQTAELEVSIRLFLWTTSHDSRR